jgi:hypothetical protein
MDIQLILIAINLGFNLIERVFKYTKKTVNIHSECMGNKLDYSNETIKDKKDKK